MGIINVNRYAKNGSELPPHAYHPNASLRAEHRKGYIAWPSHAVGERKDDVETRF